MIRNNTLIAKMTRLQSGVRTICLSEKKTTTL